MKCQEERKSAKPLEESKKFIIGKSIGNYRNIMNIAQKKKGDLCGKPPVKWLYVILPGHQQGVELLKQSSAAG